MTSSHKPASGRTPDSRVGAGSPSGGAASSTDTQDERPEGAQRPIDYGGVTEADRDAVAAYIAARYHARRQDEIIARTDAAEHDPGTPEAWRDGCDCPRPRKRGEWDVTWGCPMHDPREA